MRNLVLVLGDQLSLESEALRDFDKARDRVLMVEAAGEATHVWSHKARIALFLSAMRHFAEALAAAGHHVVYHGLGADGPENLEDVLEQKLLALRPARLIACEAGEHRIQAAVAAASERAGVELEWRRDRHFLCSRAEFSAWARGRKQLRMEFFYRHMRRKQSILMNGTEPEGGRWNFDSDNRSAFPRSGPGKLPAPPWFAPDAIARDVMAEVERRFPAHPGSLESFGWPVTRQQALAALEAFVRERLPGFGRYQDAMWTDAPFTWHSLLSSSLNLKLLDPREVVAAAEDAYRRGRAPLAAVEGFVRQILGWREFIRGVYWLEMPGLASANFFRHRRKLPAWYWTARTRMNCMRHALDQTLRYGYAHHIQRLMITGNFALLAEVEPRQVCDWYLAVYVDAVEWAELPNTIGMALFADGGRFTSKPYIASGAYIKRMSNYCDGCEYRPGLREGAQACPVTVLYWRFLDKHADRLARNPRTALMARNRNRLPAAELRAIDKHSRRILDNLDGL